MSEIKLPEAWLHDGKGYLLITREQAKQVIKALRVSLEHVKDPMAGQGDIVAAALEIFLGPGGEE